LGGEGSLRIIYGEHISLRKQQATPWEVCECTTYTKAVQLFRGGALSGGGCYAFGGQWEIKKLPTTATPFMMAYNGSDLHPDKSALLQGNAAERKNFGSFKPTFHSRTTATPSVLRMNIASQLPS